MKRFIHIALFATVCLAESYDRRNTDEINALISELQTKMEADVSAATTQLEEDKAL